MANLYSPSAAIAYSKSFIKKMSLDTSSNANVCYQIADQVNSIMWFAAPFYWTLGQLTSTVGNPVLTASAQDYGVTAPSDFLYLAKCYLTDGTNLNWLTPVAQLPSTGVQAGNPSQVAYLTTSAAVVRFWPKPAVGEARSAVLQYKRSPSLVSSGNFASAMFAFPDVYYPVYQAGVQHYAYHWADDQRAGTATVDENGKTTYTGALGQFMSLLWEMRRAEKLQVDYPGAPQAKG